MDREIKFRAWNGKEMISADNLAYEEYAPLSILLNSNDGLKLMQYTGLKINNEEIYEVDILKYENYIFVVKFGRCGGSYLNNKQYELDGFEGFYLECINDKHHSIRKDINFWINEKGIKKIGNIYDNPELLEENK